uniref:Uncharacterized protein n=1 Tax=Acartia pacifica TaxID=335913 RepID=A0A0U2IG89_ACAPC|nr:hypothetical protein [Acartia pacifica]
MLICDCFVLGGLMFSARNVTVRTKDKLGKPELYEQL